MDEPQVLCILEKKGFERGNVIMIKATCALLSASATEALVLKTL